MTYIRIDTKSKQAKKFVELIETMPFAEILSLPGNITKKAMEAAKKGIQLNIKMQRNWCLPSNLF